MRRLPGPLRTGIIKCVQDCFVIRLTDDKGSPREQKDVPFNSKGYSELEIGHKCGHLLLVRGTKGQIKAPQKPIEKGDQIVCLISNGNRPLKAHRWAFWNESVIKEWGDRKGYERFKKRERRRAVENTYP